MNDSLPLIEYDARQRITERTARAAALRLPRGVRRHRLASRLRRVADRLEG